MDLPLFTLLIAYLGLFFGFFPLIVESQQNVNSPPPHILHPPPPPPPPPPITLPPPPTPLLPAPPPPSDSLWLPQPTPRPPLPSSKKRLRPPPPKNSTSEHRDHNHQDSLKNLTPSKTKKLNEGKKIGLIFVGVVAILQVCVVAFLLIRRRQILKAKCDY